jgi:hypothetical protein
MAPLLDRRAKRLPGRNVQRSAEEDTERRVLPALVCRRHKPLGLLAHVELSENHFTEQAAHIFTQRARDQEIRPRLHLGRKKTLREALNQALQLEAAHAAVGMPTGIRHTTTTKFRKSKSPTTERKEY